MPAVRVPMFLSRIEPTDQDGYDERTFECSQCAYAETVIVQFDRADALTGLHHVGQGYPLRGRRRAGGCLAGSNLAYAHGPASVAAKMAMGT
jgi:hypothetical protein